MDQVRPTAPLAHDITALQRRRAQPGSAVRGSATDVRIRRIGPADLAGLRAFYASLSEESRRTRFLGRTSGIGERQSTWFCTPDHDHRQGFVAVEGNLAGTVGEERIVGHVCVEPEDSATAEIAIAVADDIQGTGIGRRLVDAAVGWARRDGFRKLSATMLTGNAAIQRLLMGLGLPSVAKAVGAGVIDIRIDLACPEGPRRAG